MLKKLTVALFLPGVLLSGVTDHPTTASAEAARTSDARAAKASASAGACLDQSDLSDYMGTYIVVSVQRYGGGLTTKDQARQRLGTPMISLSPDKVDVAGNSTIKHPTFRIRCVSVLPEGEVPGSGNRVSMFYGVGAARLPISVLQIHDPRDKDPTPYYEFELLQDHGVRRLQYLDDGWLYRLEAQR